MPPPLQLGTLSNDSRLLVCLSLYINFLSVYVSVFLCVYVCLLVLFSVCLLVYASVLSVLCVCVCDRDRIQCLLFVCRSVVRGLL